MKCRVGVAVQAIVVVALGWCAHAQAAEPSIQANLNQGVILGSDGRVWQTGRTFGVANATPAIVSAAGDVVEVDASISFGFLRHGDGSVSVFGAGYWLSSGIPGETQFPVPRKIPELTGVRQLAAMFDHVLALGDDGAVWAWGDNSFGQLGDGSTQSRTAPVRVQGLPANIRSVAVGSLNSYAVTSDGRVFGWGFTCCGALGSAVPLDVAGFQPHPVPVQIPGLSGIVEIVAGNVFAIARRSDGSLWGMGGFALGRGPDGNRDGRTPERVLLDAEIVALDAGAGFVVALARDGGVWTWGNSISGELGHGDTRSRSTPARVAGLPQIVSVGAGMSSTFAISADGSVYAWGLNSHGQLGDGTGQTRSRPVMTLGPVSEAPLFNVRNAMPGADNRPPVARVQLAASGDAVAPASVVAHGQESSDADGRIVSYQWSTSDGATALGPDVSFRIERAGTATATLVVTDDRGARGLQTERLYVKPPTFAVSTRPKAVLADVQQAAAVTASGRVLTWGFSAYLGTYDRFVFSDQSVPFDPVINGALSVSASGNTKFVVLADGSVLSFGNNGNGLLGTGTTEPHVNEPNTIAGLPPVSEVTDGNTHVLALTRDGRVYTWGTNESGQLGLGDRDLRTVPNEVPALGNIVAVGAGYEASYALARDGTLYAWGRNSNGSLGIGDTTREFVTSPARVEGAPALVRLSIIGNDVVAFDSRDRAFATGSAIADLAPDAERTRAYEVPALSGFRKVVGQFSAGVALHLDGSVWTFGLPGVGTLGYVTAETTSQPLRRLDGVDGISDVSAGAFGVIALRANGTALSWGHNEAGQLGQGTFAFQATPRPIRGVAGAGFLDLDAPNASGTLLDAAPNPTVRPPIVTRAKTSGEDDSKAIVTDVDYGNDASASGDVLITAFVREGVLFPATPVVTVSTESRKDIGDKYVTAVLTPQGWQPLADGSGKPYFSGTLGAASTNLPVFSNLASGALDGSIFCVGYTTAAGQGLGDKYGPVFTGANVAASYQCPRVDRVSSASSVSVQPGFWYDPAEGGRGFYFKKDGDTIALVAYLFETSGRPTWFISSGQMSGDTYTGQMLPFSNGQSITSAYRAPTPGASLGTMSLRFTSPTTAVLNWPGGTVPLVHARFEDAGPGFPENGVWFNPEESGAGYTIEIQGTTIGLGAYFFEEDGGPVWYLYTAQMNTSRSMAGTWLRYRDGQSLLGAYRAPSSQAAGDIALEFTAPGRAVLTLPNGRRVPIQRLF